MMHHAIGWAAVFFAMIGAAVPAHAQIEQRFDGIAPTAYLKKWRAKEWKIWAMPDGSCLALTQDPKQTPFQFWGFRQVVRSKIELIFGSFENPRPRTVQMSFNRGGRFDYQAKVVQYATWNAYTVTLQGRALAVFHDQTIIEAFTGDTRIFAAVTDSTRKLEQAMSECHDWQLKP